jgi:hypothetical protein
VPGSIAWTNPTRTISTDVPLHRDRVKSEERGRRKRKPPKIKKVEHDGVGVAEDGVANAMT